MWNLVPEKDKRKFKVMEKLLTSKAPITIRSLADEANCSVRIIKYDLDELKEELLLIEGNLISSSKGISLELPGYFGLDYFQRKLFDTSPAFRFLEGIFLYDSFTYTEMENFLFISPSSLARLTNKLKKELKEYNLELLTGPFRIVGNERVIRYFFTIYFRERSSILDWPFSEVEESLTASILNSVVQRYGLNPAVLDHHYFRVLIAVNIIREKQGHTFLAEDSLSQLQRSSQLEYPSLSTGKEKVYYEEVQYWDFLFSMYLKSEDESSYIFQKEIEEIQNVLVYIADLFSLSLQNTNYLIFTLNNLLRLYALHSKGKAGKNFILFEPRDIFLIKHYQKNFPYFYQVSEELLMKLCTERGIKVDEKVSNSIMYALLSKWEGLTAYLIENFNYCHILLYSHYNLTHAQNIKEELLSELDSSTSISVYPFFELSEEKLEEMEFDILVSTTTLFINIEQPVLYLYRSGLALNLEVLKNNIEKIIVSNKEYHREKIQKKNN